MTKKRTPEPSANRTAKPTASDLALVRRGRPHQPTVILPNGLEYLEAAAARGLSQAAAAALLGISDRTLHACFEAQPESREAWDKGLAKLEDELTGLLLKQAREGSIAAIIFGLKNKAGWSDNGPRTAPTETRISITLPAPMTREQYVTSGTEVTKP